MKKITSFALLLCLILGAVFSLSACSGGDEEVPEGMQIAGGGESDGYYFYVPEEWIVSSHGKFDAAYVSSVNNTSVTFVEAEMPEESIGEYFAKEESKFPFPINVTERDKAINFGNAESAKSFVYSYTYEEKEFCCLQIFVTHKDEFYIFTYTSYTADYTDGLSYYDYYLEEKVLGVMENFKFVDKSGEGGKAPEYTKDADGYNLVSDKTAAGFLMYLPDTYTVDYSGGIVSATNADGVNISMSKATYANVTVDEYWKNRKQELETIADKVASGETYVSSLEEIEIGKSKTVEGTKWAFSYEYTYVLLGRTYHVYQVLMVKGQNGYVFTFTADEDNYGGYFGEVDTILDKLEF